MQMLVARGYVIPEDKLRQSLLDFHEGNKEAIGLLSFAAIRDVEEDSLESENKIIVFFPSETKLANDNIVDFLAKMND